MGTKSTYGEEHFIYHQNHPTPEGISNHAVHPHLHSTNNVEGSPQNRNVHVNTPMYLSPKQERQNNNDNENMFI